MINVNSRAIRLRVYCRIVPCMLSGVITILFFAGCDVCNPADPELTTEEMYQNAVLDAVIAEENEICSSLIPVIESNEELIWNDGRILAVAFTKYADSYPAGETVQTWWGDTWVTAFPEIKEFFLNQKTDDKELTLRIEQLLGLPPESGNEWFAELWVRPEDLFRPSPDPEITDTVAELDFIDNATEEHIEWFNNNILHSYFKEEKYPWTRLGYTYDWGNPDNETGLSEFVIKQNSEVIVKSLSSIGEYFQ